MAEVLSGVASVASLADVCCRLAGSLYQSFRAVKEAPQDIQRLSDRLDALRHLLVEVDHLVQRYPTSTIVTQDAYSVRPIHVFLQACQSEFTEIDNSAAGFQKKSGKWKDVRRRLRFILDERTVERHCDTLKELIGRLNTELSVAGR